MSITDTDGAATGSDQGQLPARGRAAAEGKGIGSRAAKVAHVYATPILLIAFLVIFSVAEPSTFGTWSNLSTILSSQATIGCLALAAIVPLAIGEFDLSFGYAIGFIGLVGVALGNEGLPPALTMAIMLLAGILIGLVNGLLVVRFNISSFIA